MAVILGIIIWIALFLLLREVFCWYWKVNRRLATLESIDEKLALLIKLETAAQPPPPPLPDQG